MSNIFAPLFRPTGKLIVDVGVGPVIGGTEYMHMRITDLGGLAVSGEVIHHYGDALPFDIDGRLVVSANDVVRWDQGIPFTATGAVAMVTDDALLPGSPPVWSALPPAFNYEADGPQSYYAYPYVYSSDGPLVNWSLDAPPAGFSVDQNGFVHVTAPLPVGVHNIVIRVENDNGPPGATGTLVWTITAGAVPTWDPIPGQSTRENNLPTNLDVSGYVNSPTSAITGYSLVAPPAGFTINASGVITVAPGTAVAVHAIVVQATNASGSANSLPFNWEILEELLIPQWGAIPDQENFRDELPQNLPTAPHVTSNNGPLSGWTLSPVLTGFSIDTAGVVTATQAAAEQLHTMAVTVSNASGPATSPDFDWLVKVFRLPPVWPGDGGTGTGGIPARADREDTLPQDYDMKPYVGSNDGALTGWAINPGVAGFTISPAGVITAASGLTPGVYPLTIEVSNPQGTSPQSFNWTIREKLLAPVWDTIPDQTDRQNVLPQSFESSLYVTSNDGQALFAWTLINAPAGFSINSSGRVTCLAGTAVAAHTMQVRVSNNSGTSTSATFTWNVLEELLVPQWSTIPNQNDDEDTLPQALDVSPYVTSNSGALTGWTLVGTNNGFIINGSGVVTAQSGTAPGSYTVTVQVSNDTGSSQKAFNWTINSVAATEYFHEFNADLGAFSFSRLSDGSAPQSPAEEHQRAFVDANVPCYWGCPATQREGGVFLPGPDWAGLYLERPSTNYCFDSTDHYKDPPWTAFETTVVDSGDPNRMRRTTAGTAAVFQQVAVPSSGDYTYSLDHQQSSTAPGKEIYVSLDNFTTTRAFNTEVNFVRAWKTQSTGTTVGASTGFSALASGVSTTTTGERWYLNHSQVEQGENWTSAIKTVGSNTASRAGTVAQCLPADMGLDPAAMRTNHCGQVKFYNMWDILPGTSICHQMLIDSNNYIWIAFLGSGELVAEFNVDGTKRGFFSTTVIHPDLFDLIDVRWKMTTTGYTVWFNGEKMTGGAGGTWPVGDLEITPGGGLSADAGNIMFRTIRVNSTALSDAAIEAWT